MATFRSARKLSSYLVRAKLYPIERIVDSHECKGKRCKVCLNVQETSYFSSSVTNETYKINHQFECNEKCLVYSLTCKKCLKHYVGQTIDTFLHRWHNYKCNDRKSQRSEPCMQEHSFRHFSSPGHNGFLSDVSVTFIDKTNPSDPLKRENYLRETLWLWRPMGLISKIVSEFYHLIILKLALFILPIYRTLWIIGTACFSGLESRKISLFSHYFINFSFTFPFIVTSVLTMVTLLLLLFLLMLPVLFPFVICCLVLLLF